jgi:hypothetical protein
LRKTITDDTNIPDGTYTLGRWHLSPLYGGSLFVNNIAADGDAFLRVVSPIQADYGLTVKGDLHVDGNVTCDGAIKSPFWCAGAIAADGSVLSSRGQVGFTVTKIQAGLWQITYALHPDSIPIVLLGACVGASRLYLSGMASNNFFRVWTREWDYGITDSPWNFSVLA